MSSQLQPNLNIPLSGTISNQTPVQEDFYLLDVVGGASVIAMHPSKPIVAYNTGCMIIIYNMASDTKINLVHHQHEVQALAFTPVGAGQSESGGDFLISVDYNRNELEDSNKSYNSSMCLWNWMKGMCIQEVKIPKASNVSSIVYGQITNNTVRSLRLSFDRQSNNFLVMESSPFEQSGGYRASIWNLNRQQRLELLNQVDLDYQASCLGIAILQKGISQANSTQNFASSSIASPRVGVQPRMRFVTLEKTCLKFWEYSQGQAKVVKQVKIKQNMKNFALSDITGFLYILGENGKVLILDSEGEFVSTLQREGVYFTTVGTASDKLMLGSDRGTIFIYHMASLQFINEVPYQLSQLSNFCLNRQTDGCSTSFKNDLSRQDPVINPLLDNNGGTLKLKDESLSLFKVGPPVVLITITSNMRYLLVKYADMSFAVVDRTIKDPAQAIIGYSYGHFEEVTNLQWMTKQNKSLRAVNPGPSQLVKTANECFVTCSSDMSVFIWKHFGDRWTFSYIDIVKCFDQSLSFQRKYSDMSTQNLRLTALVLLPKYSQLAIGDSKGIVRTFKLEQDKAHLIASYTLDKPTGLAGDDYIKQIHVTKDEQYAIVAFRCGLVCTYDAKNAYKLVGVIEKYAQPFGFSEQPNQQIRVLEKVNNTTHSYSCSSSYREEVPVYSALDFNGVPANSIYTTSFRVLSVVSPNCIKLQAVEIKGSKLSKTQIVQYVIDEGRISGFDVHPSNDYLLITSNKGRIFVFRVDTGELRGTIQIPLHAKGCCIDPSGLYVLVQVPPFSPKNTVNLSFSDNHLQDDNLLGLGTNEREMERSTLLMFEVGTGVAAAEIKSVFEIAQMRFSSDGRYLSIGSFTGSVSVWSVGDHLHQNMRQVLETLRIQPDFWFNYPIFLPDYGNYGTQQPLAREALEPYRLGDEQIVSERGLMSEMDAEQLSINTPSQPFQKGLRLPSNQVYATNQRPIHAPFNESYPLLPESQGAQKQLTINDYYQNLNRADKPQSGQNSALKKMTEEQQNKFYRKTSVEDQQTQITPNQSYHQMNHQQQQQPGLTEPIYQSELIQTQQRGPDYQNFGVKTRNQQERQDQTNRTHSYQHPDCQNKIKQRQKLQTPYMEAEGVNSYPNLENKYSHPNGQHLPEGHVNNLDEPRVKQRDSARSSRQGFIDRTMNDKQLQYEQANGSPSQLLRPGAPSAYKYLQDQKLDCPQPAFMRSTDCGVQLENPFSHNLGNYQDHNKELGAFLNNQKYNAKLCSYQGNLAGMPSRQVNHDPSDIDDDVGDQSPYSLKQSLQELDGMNKYLQNVNLPLKYQAADSFPQQRGYTLASMREEERKMGSRFPNNQSSNISPNSSTYEVVEEMYENLNDFENKLKAMKRPQNIPGNRVFY